MTLPSSRFWRLAAGVPLTTLLSPQVTPALSPIQAVDTEAQADARWTFHHEHVLGTSLEIVVRANDLVGAREAESAALRAIDRQAAILSTWNPKSEVSRWASTRFQPIAVSPELFEVLASFDEWRARSGGALDASVGAASQLWERTTAEGHVPSDHEIAMAVEAMQQPHWQLNVQQHTATRLSDVPLAFASFVKSYVISRAADAALGTGARGVMLNAGGDVIVRGDMTQLIAVADPKADSENEAALEHLVLRDGAVATSGSYRRGYQTMRGFRKEGPQFSHIIDPRSARPVGHVLSATVMSHDAVTAGALATALSVLPVDEGEQLARSFAGTQYLLVLSDGREVRGSTANTVSSGLHLAAFLPRDNSRTVNGAWNPAFELNLTLELPRMEDARYRRPYVAVWIEDADHFPVRTLALWTQNPRWLPDLKQWYRDDQVRSLAEGTDLSRTVSSATRPPGRYTLKWDGRDNEGKPVKAGRYTVFVEAAREHGGYDLQRHEVNFDGQAQQLVLPGAKELGATALDYRKR